MANIESRWLTHLKRMHALAHSGLAFSPVEFDRERYEEMITICEAMLSDLAQKPIDTIADLITPHHQRYVTPQIEVRGACFLDNKVLLVQEKSDEKWTLPGGYADVGLSAIENIEKEIIEEAGLDVVATQLVSVRHKAKGDYKPDIRDFYKLLFVCHQTCTENPKASAETIDAKYFSLDALPELSLGRTITRDIIDAYDCYRNKDHLTIIE